jgi:hypothetical protein
MGQDYVPYFVSSAELAKKGETCSTNLNCGGSKVCFESGVSAKNCIPYQGLVFTLAEHSGDA